jgi:hypothetical protein
VKRGAPERPGGGGEVSDGDDSDGYGDQGLSWEAVMASVMVSGVHLSCVAHDVACACAQHNTGAMHCIPGR